MSSEEDRKMRILYNTLRVVKAGKYLTYTMKSECGTDIRIGLNPRDWADMHFDFDMSPSMELKGRVGLLSGISQEVFDSFLKHREEAFMGLLSYLLMVVMKKNKPEHETPRPWYPDNSEYDGLRDFLEEAFPKCAGAYDVREIVRLGELKGRDPISFDGAEGKKLVHQMSFARQRYLFYPTYPFEGGQGEILIPYCVPVPGVLNKIKNVLHRKGLGLTPELLEYLWRKM